MTININALGLRALIWLDPASPPKRPPTERDFTMSADHLASNTSTADLFARFSAAANGGRPELRRGFTKRDIAMAVVQAEA